MGKCKELNNSPQIQAVAAADGRLLTRYAANSRSNGAARRGWRTREFGEQGWRSREVGDQRWRCRAFGDQGADKKRVETRRAEQPYLGLSRELWAERKSATSRQWSGTQACRKHRGKRYVKDKWVIQESRTLDPEWRDPAGRAQKGNNGRSALAAGSVDHEKSSHQDRSKYQSEQSVNQVIYEGATTRQVVGSSAVGSIQGARSPRPHQ